MTPGRFEASRSSGADVALLDLEDSVPGLAKDSARADVLGFVGGIGGGGEDGPAVLGVRVNALGTVHGLKDVVALADSGRWPAVLLLPKVEAARDVELVAQIADTGQGECRIWALIETPQGIQHLAAILCAPHLAGVLFGAGDYAAAAGCRLTSKALWHPRAALAAGAAAAGLPAVDSPYFDLCDLDGLRQEAEEAVELGFVGKVAVHPEQLPVIQAVFQPDPCDVAVARAVVRAADAADGGITTVDGRMVGPPLVTAARALTARAGDEPAPTSPSEVPC
ncbi:HpcH/HpaI aldolase/citrate lyase family protein, partial [Streptomyces sp. NPDC059003]|uniref:HpcH/HpaI aldolase/citrate lyase family protein n=1 Tax=Streptomyces sp. NPDC059003 TaxID=3346691 RepID=UPI0036AE3571